MKRSPHSKLSDARLRALLKGLRQDVAAPPDFSARVLKSLRAQGLLSDLIETQTNGGPWWTRLGAGLWVRPRWGLALAAGLVLALSLGWVWRPVCRACGRGAAPAPLIGVSQTKSVASHPASTLVLVAPRRARSRTARFVAARSAPRSGSMVLAYDSAGSVGRSAPVAGRSVSLVSSAPLVGLGSTAPGAGISATVSGLVASGSRLPASSGVTSGTLAETPGFSSYRSSAGGPIPSPTPVPTATPQRAATPPPSLVQNSQVRNNVILASRGQSAQILFKVAQGGPVSVAIYSRLGQKVAVLQDGSLPPGQYDLSWSGQGEGGMVASGIYEVIIQTPTYTDLHKMMLVK